MNDRFRFWVEKNFEFSNQEGHLDFGSVFESKSILKKSELLGHKTKISELGYPVIYSFVFSMIWPVGIFQEYRGFLTAV